MKNEIFLLSWPTPRHLTPPRKKAGLLRLNEMEKLLTPKQLCELLQVGQSTVYLWTHTEFLPFYKLGKSVRFEENEIWEWVRQRKRKSSGRATMKYDINALLG